MKDAYNEFEVEDILESLSKGPDALDRAYEEATKRIDHQPVNRRYYAHLTISWMVQCLRPLTPNELQHAVTKPEHLERVLAPSGLVKIDTLVSFCAGLVTIDHESNVVRFVHYTTQEYFTRDRLTKWLPGADMDPARVCTNYMMSSKLSKAIERAHEHELEHVRKQNEWLSSTPYHTRQWSGSSTLLYDLEMVFHDALAHWPFLDYCKKHWAAHCSEFQMPLQDLLLQFLTGPAKIVYAEMERHCWVEWENYQGVGGVAVGSHVANVNLRRVTPISICARWGLHYLISNLLDQGSEIRVAPMLDDDYEKQPHSYTWEPGFDSSPPLRHVALDEPFLLACQNGDMELAALLLARTSIQDDVYYEAFRALDESVNLDMLDLIIERCPLDAIYLTKIAMCSSIDEVRIRNGLMQSKLQVWSDQHGADSSLQVVFERQSASFWVEYILEHGFDVQAVFRSSYWQRTGIEHAAAAGCLESVRILLNYPGVQVCRADPGNGEYHEDALGLAAEGRHVKVFRALLSHVSSIPDAADLVQSGAGRVFQNLTNPFSWGSGPLLKEVTLLKALFEYQDFSRLPFTRLEKTIHVAVSDVSQAAHLESQSSILDLILHELAIDFRCRGIHGHTLLQSAASHALAGRIESTEEQPVFADETYTRTLGMLLEHPNFDYTGQYYNPITWMLKKYRYSEWESEDQGKEGLNITLKLQMILKDPRFDPDTPDDTGRTALSYACEYHYEYLVRTLLQHSLVDVNSRDVSGRTPLSYAAGSECGRHCGSDGNQWAGEQSVLPILLANDNVRKNSNSPDAAGITPLMYSCRLGRQEHVELLLGIAGSEVNLTDNRGRTPLLHALENSGSENEPLAVLLANPNINVNARDKDGRSALFYVFRYQDPWSRSHINGRPNITLILQHEDLDLSEDLKYMCDDDGWGLDADSVLRSVKELRERDTEFGLDADWPLPNSTELRCLDYLESMFSEGEHQSDADADADAYLLSDADSAGAGSYEE